jgi:hypothetical protein
MAYIGNDFEIDYTNKRLTHKASGVAVYTANQLYSWLQNTFDELVQMDNPVPMSAQTPTAYTLINGWFMDYESFKFLDTGAVTTIGWDAGEYDDGIRIFELTSSNYVSATSGDIGKTVIGVTTGESGILLAYDNTERKWWLRANPSGLFDNLEDINVQSGDGSGTMKYISKTGENLWSNLYTLGTLEAGTNVYIAQSGVKIDSWWPAGHIDVLVNVREADKNIDYGNLTIFARQYTKTYDHFTIDVKGGGRNAVPLATAADLNNTTASGVVAGYNDIIITQVNGEIPYSGAGGWARWDVITGNTSDATAVVLDDDTTDNTLTLGNVSGVFQVGETINGGAGAGATSGTLDVSVTYLHRDLNNGNGLRPYDIHCKLQDRPLSEWYEWIKFVNRRTSAERFYQNDGSGLYWTDGEQYIAAQDTFTPVKASPLGTFAGGTYFGAQGVWIEDYDDDDAKNFQLIDSSGVTQTPPNSVAIKVTSVVAGDRIAVFVLTGAGGDIDKSQYLAAAGNDNGDPDFVVQGSIAADAPQAGYLRIANSDGSDDLYVYDSWTGATFTLTTGQTLDRSYSAGEPAYVPIVDIQASGTEVSNTLIYGSDIPVLVRVRRYGILPFEVESDVTNTGLTVAAIRTTDTIVS